MHVMSIKEKGCQKWLMFSKFWSRFNKTQHQVETNTIQMNQVFPNCFEEDEIYSLTVKEIVEAQKADATLKHFFKRNAVLDKGVELQLVVDILERNEKHHPIHNKVMQSLPSE
jgi:hypothetical protein